MMLTDDEARKELRKLCAAIGCSGMSQECHTNPERCELLQKLMKHAIAVRRLVAPPEAP